MRIPVVIQSAETRSQIQTANRLFCHCSIIMDLFDNLHLPTKHPTSPHQYFLGRGGINEISTGSNSNFGSSASGANVAFVVFSQFLSSRSGYSGL